MRLLTLALFLMPHCVSAQDAVSFPAAFTGNWKGQLEWFPLQGASRTVPMQLRITPTDSGFYQWQLQYGTDGADVRSYALLPVDTATGHWRIDERNSIVLDCWWKGNKLHSVFSMNQVTLMAAYWIEQGNLHIEFVSFGKAAVTASGGVGLAPAVESYKVMSRQHAVLLKQR